MTMRYEAPFEVGDLVRLDLWDETVPPHSQYGLCRVTQVSEARCQTGWLVAFASVRNGARGELDAAWLQPAEV
jgi:hypothetical protein